MKIESKQNTLKEVKWMLSWGIDSNRKCYLKFIFESSRWESHWGNTSKKRYKGRYWPFTCLVSQAFPVESRDMLWIIFEDGVLFPEMLFCSSCSNYNPVRPIVLDCRSFLLSAVCHRNDRKPQWRQGETAERVGIESKCMWLVTFFFFFFFKL